MKTIKGYILIEKDDAISSCKKYNSKVERDMIIKKWIKHYRLHEKSYVIIIQPELNISDLLNIEKNDGDKKILYKGRCKKKI